VMLPALFGAEFQTTDNAATVLVAAQAFGAMSVVSSTMIFAIERGEFLAKTGIIGVILILVSGVTIIPLFGIQGAVAGRIIVQVLLTVFGFLYVAKSLNCALPFSCLSRLATAAGACAAAARLIVLQWPTLSGAAGAVAVGAAIYFCLVRALKALPSNDLQRIRDWGDSVPARLAPAVRPVVKLLFG
ncbi:MAG: polysaccharide biosynthesis C-terminal domain-containing protein, partial [Methylocystis sp.]|nr:polysaccharide biosynthesis C-terminal domain-containing protein [Methylocystis sp.]